ncbi:hypothetical protein chiPu_0017407 [Chiloscyllium punctatum]|uniref:Ig-like domain-containing protein n=1 Tax=Chiloscyllium punctatum TaxID=137246 RepID=A0A401RFN8_CHIPU|nr:hypothetical protein [Chiloscyllium punctatum]
MFGAYSLHILLLLLPASCMSVLVSQLENHLSVGEGKMAEMHCYQNDTNENYMYWYRKHRGAGLELIVTSIFGSEPTFEESFKKRFEVTRTSQKSCSLKIRSLVPTDTAVYYCAASDHSVTTRLGAGSKTYWLIIP